MQADGGVCFNMKKLFIIPFDDKTVPVNDAHTVVFRVQYGGERVDAFCKLAKIYFRCHGA